MATIALTQETIETTIQQSGILLVDFWADWCGPCKQFAPVFEAASEKYPDITFGKVDTEAEQVLSASAGIQAIPTLVAFREGVMVFRHSGALPAAAIDELVGKIRELDMDQVRAEMAQDQA